MKLKIVAIADRGLANKERLHLVALADTNLTYFVVFDTERTPVGGVVAKPKHAYWFTDNPVKAGDHVILGTGPGANSVEKRPDGKTNYFMYWGQPNTLWNKNSACAVLLEINTWVTSEPPVSF